MVDDARITWDFSGYFRPAGCAFLTSPMLDDTLSTTSDYFRDLSGFLGITESQIYPYSPAATLDAGR